MIAIVLFFGFGSMYLWNEQRNSWLKAAYDFELREKVLAKHYELVTKYANDIIIIADNKYKVTFANEKASEVYGYTYDEFLKLDIKELRAPEEAKDMFRIWKRLKDLVGVLWNLTIEKRTAQSSRLRSAQK